MTFADAERGRGPPDARAWWGLPRRSGWRHNAGLHHPPQVVADRPVLDDQAVAKPKALGVVEVNPPATGSGPRELEPGDDLVAVGEELL